MTTFTYKGHQVEVKPSYGDPEIILVKIDGEYRITRGVYSEYQGGEVAKKIIDANQRPSS